MLIVAPVLDKRCLCPFRIALLRNQLMERHVQWQVASPQDDQLNYGIIDIQWLRIDPGAMRCDEINSNTCCRWMAKLPSASGV